MVGFLSPVSRERRMEQLPEQASVVVIGAGIMGNCMACHLARAGWRDIVLLDKGPFPNPGGSTGHASNFLFPVDHSKEMTKFTQDAIREYEELGVSTRSGGIEGARTKEWRGRRSRSPRRCTR